MRCDVRERSEYLEKAKRKRDFGVMKCGARRVRRGECRFWAEDGND